MRLSLGNSVNGLTLPSSWNYSPIAAKGHVTSGHIDCLRNFQAIPVGLQKAYEAVSVLQQRVEKRPGS
jgi:hypothetical protein